MMSAEWRVKRKQWLAGRQVQVAVSLVLSRVRSDPYIVRIGCGHHLYSPAKCNMIIS